MSSSEKIQVLVLGSGPGALSIAAALCKENLKVEILSKQDPNEPWPYTYGIWGEEVDALGLGHLLEHRWSNTVSFFGQGSQDRRSIENFETKHGKDYGLFDKVKLQAFWLSQCENGSIAWHKGSAKSLDIDNFQSTVTTTDGSQLKARLVIDATGYEPVFLKAKDQGPIAVQTCYGIVGEFSSNPIEERQFVLMDYRNDHLSKEETQEPPTFLYAMDLGNGKFFLEETSLGLYPPVKLEVLKERLHRRLNHKNIKLKNLIHEELGIFLPMNIPIPDLNQPILGFGGSAGMVHPASGYLVGSLLRRAPLLAKAIAKEMASEVASPADIARKGWEALWPQQLRRKQALYKFGLEKLMRFKEEQLREFFHNFFELPKEQWYGFLTNSLSLNELVSAMWDMFKKSPWNVKWGLMRMQGREVSLLWKFIYPEK